MQLVEQLAQPGSARAIDALLDHEAVIASSRQIAIGLLEAAQRSKKVNRAVKALRDGRVPESTEGLDDAVIAAIERVRAHEQLRAELAVTAAKQFDDDDAVLAARIAAIVGDPRFREALFWQNPTAARGAIESLLRGAATDRDSKSRQHRRLVAGYVARYCVKNDTIGFFGPVGWASLGTDATRMQVGANLVCARRVYFEYWAIDALARALANDPALQPALVPRLAPTLRVDGTQLQLRDGSVVELPGVAVRVLALVDGQRSARTIAAQLIGDPASQLADEAEVVDVLRELAAKQVCTFDLEIPASTQTPETHLRALLDAAGPAGSDGLRVLGELEGRRTAVAAAAGDPAALDTALGELSATFERLTGAGSERKGGETYAGRTLVYEDTRRDVELDLGRAVIDRFATPLAIVLDSARWFTHAIATRYEIELRRSYRELVAERGGEVPFVVFRDRIARLFGGGEAGIVAGVTRELQARWQELLGITDWDARRHVATSVALAPRLDDAFRAPGPGWPSARHHAPDLMIAARSIEDLQRGELVVVLGELHAGLNTVTLPCLLAQHPEPSILVRARELDLPEPNIAPTWSRARNRADFFSVSRHDFDLEAGGTRSARPREQVIAAGELVVEEHAGVLGARTRDGRARFAMIALLEQHLIAETYAQFQLFASRPHTPRIELDGLVLNRERWSVGPEALDFAAAATPVERFAGARRLARALGLPRRVFVKSDTEAKPFHVDLESPILVEVLAKQVKQASRVGISEMLPSVDECWLTDAAGATYTAELRIAATDPRHWTPVIP